MSYFQQQSPWMEAAQYGRGLGDVLGRYLTELPRLQAETSIAQGREPLRLALMQSQIEGQGLENQMRQAALPGVRTRGQYDALRLAEEQRQQQAGQQFRNTLSQPQQPLDEDLAGFPVGAMGFGPKPQDLLLEAIKMGAHDEVSPILHMLQEQHRAKEDEAQAEAYRQHANYYKAQTEALKNPMLRASPDQSVALFGHGIDAVKAMSPGGLAPDPNDSGFPVYSMGTNIVQQIGDQLLHRTGQGPQQGGTVRVINPQGKPVRIPQAQLQEALQQGYRLNQ